MKFTASQIATFLGGEVVGNPNVEVSNFSKIEEGQSGTLTFLANPKYTPYIYITKADIVLVNADFEADKPIEATLIKVPNAYAALAKLMELANQSTPQKLGKEHPHHVAESTILPEDTYVGAFAYVGKHVSIGKNVKIYPQVFIGDNVQLGDNVVLYPGVRIYHGCQIGNNCIIHAGTVIGADGFGFSHENGAYKKIPQLGNVIIEDDVEIGANTTIDRAVMGSTIIHRGVKLDNLVQIAHNTEVGEHTVMAAQTGVAGSTKVGKHCVFGGQVGIGGHIHIGDNTQVGAQSGIISNIKPGAEIMGSPAYAVKSYFKASVLMPKLPDMYKQLALLQKEVEKLKSEGQKEL